MAMDILIYRTSSGRVPFKEWLDGLGDLAGRTAIQRRLVRAAGGNLGDHQACRGGIWELRVDQGPGYRVYFGRAGNAVIVLLAGGTKASQNRDIERAIHAWRDYRNHWS